MHGLGNDYVFVDCLETELKNPQKIAREISRRHFSIGSDGLILICPSGTADFRMKMYNADGSVGSMCGNGIRCLGKYVYDHGKTDSRVLHIETDAGIRRICLETEQNRVVSVRVDMGIPEFEPSKIPVRTNEKRILQKKMEVGDRTFFINCLSMGNPHCVVFLEETDRFDVARYGKLLEHHELFPDRTNVEFVQMIDENTLKMRVWERGSGETYACGTGACAAAVAACMNGFCGRRVTVRLKGGDLFIQWDERDRQVYMTGPAAEVCTGVWKSETIL